MKPSITRWKIVPGYIASDDVMPSLVHSRPPVARSTKFLTVLGACSGISVTVNEPLLVTNVAVVIRGPFGSGSVGVERAQSLPEDRGTPHREVRIRGRRIVARGAVRRTRQA